MLNMGKVKQQDKCIKDFKISISTQQGSGMSGMFLPCW